MGRLRSSKLSLHPLRAAPVKPPRLTRGLSARPRSLPLPWERTRRTKTAWLILQASFKERSRHTSNKLRRLKKLQLSILLSSGRLNKTSKKPKKGPSLPWFCKWKTNMGGTLKSPFIGKSYPEINNQVFILTLKTRNKYLSY